MPRSVDYYFSLVSPWAYLGHAPFVALAKRHGLQIRYKPMSLGVVFPETGGLPLAKRAPARQRYRMMELQRWREKRGVPLNLHPAHWPFDVDAADHLAVAVVLSGADPDPFLRKAFAAVWAEEKNLADDDALAGVAASAGLPADALLTESRSDATKAAYRQNVADALAADAFGSPCYVLDGEVFWGQDRLDLLDDAVSSGRKPYRSDV